MLKRFRLLEENLLCDVHFPVQVLFNIIADERFMETLAYISEGYGFGENFGACTFPADLDEYDIATEGGFDGVVFSLDNGEEVLLNYDTFYYYLKKVCAIHIEDYPDDKQVVNELLGKFRKLFNIRE